MGKEWRLVTKLKAEKEEGGAGRQERAVPGMGTGRAEAAPGMTTVGTGLGTGARHGIPIAVRDVFIYKTRNMASIS